MKKLIFLIIILTIPTIIYISTKNQEEYKEIKKENTKTIICIDSEINKEYKEKIKEIETENIKIGKEECDIEIKKNIEKDEKYEKMFTEISLVVGRFDNPKENINEEKLKNLEKITKEEVKKDKNKIGIIQIEELEHIYKIIPIENNNPISEDFNEETYPLKKTYYISKPKNEKEKLLKNKIIKKIGEKKYEKEKIIRVIITGTSTIGARTYHNILKTNPDPTRPIKPIANILQRGDITHISNESPFWPKCEQSPQTLVFCGLPETIELLNYAGINLVGLTGNHILDYGQESLKYTLELYKENNIEYFGGGMNKEEARTPTIIEIKNTKFAFLGYNLIPPTSYWATEEKGGNVQISNENLKEDIEKAKELADFVLIDMQWGEEYQHTPVAHQTEYGKKALEYGATIISGVHPHWVQGIEYFDEGVIFYGLGNFIFDQLRQEETREGIIVEHIFYKNKYIGYNIIPTWIDTNLQINLAEEKRKEKILNTIFNYSNIN